jgi:hypothetical protein
VKIVERFRTVLTYDWLHDSFFEEVVVVFLGA